MNGRVLAFLFLLLIPSVAGCNQTARVERAVLVKADGSKSPELDVEIVDTPGKRQLGLMYRRELGRTQGMFFVFDEEAPRAFWMKNTYIELDMLFFDSKGVLVSKVERAIPLTESPRESKLPARYVLEVPGGSAKEWGIQEGDRILFLTPFPPLSGN